jgi:hypothetical protein
VFLETDASPSRIVGTIASITERKRAEEHVRLLMCEVNHRAKNLLSVAGHRESDRPRRRSRGVRKLDAPAEELAATGASRAKVLGQYKTSDANISDFMIEKERVESHMEIIVIALFALGSLLAGLGRTLEMLAARRAAGER